jgi:GNAT superfamily N-acetyltransferase
LKEAIIVLEAMETDYAALRDIYLKVRQAAFHWEDPDQLKLEDFDTSTEGELILAALIDNEIVGFASIWVPDNFIHNLFVRAEFQGKGVGTALVNEVKKRVGLPLMLKCVKANTPALNYYQTHNWRIEKEDRDEHGAYYWMKYDIKC